MTGAGRDPDASSACIVLGRSLKTSNGLESSTRMRSAVQGSLAELQRQLGSPRRSWTSMVYAR